MNTVFKHKFTGMGNNSDVYLRILYYIDKAGVRYPHRIIGLKIPVAVSWKLTEV